MLPDSTQWATCVYNMYIIILQDRNPHYRSCINIHSCISEIYMYQHTYTCTYMYVRTFIRGKSCFWVSHRQGREGRARGQERTQSSWCWRGTLTWHWCSNPLELCSAGGGEGRSHLAHFLCRYLDFYSGTGNWCLERTGGWSNCGGWRHPRNQTVFKISSAQHSLFFETVTLSRSQTPTHSHPSPSPCTRVQRTMWQPNVLSSKWRCADSLSIPHCHALRLQLTCRDREGGRGVCRERWRCSGNGVAIWIH